MEKKIDKKKIGCHFGYDVFSVDAKKVRELSLKHQEFTNYAINDDFSDLIGKNEIWVNNIADKTEVRIYIDVAAYRLHKLECGDKPLIAYKKSVKYEKMLREKIERVKHIQELTAADSDEKVYVRLYKAIKNGNKSIKVYIVDGDYVRDKYHTEYVEGGHGYVYSWIPKDEIWIDNDTAEIEWPFIIEHEYYELRLMRDHSIKYEDAHAKACKVEYDMRKDAAKKKTEDVRAALGRMHGKTSASCGKKI